jgi:hypothetical protein
MDVTIIHRKKGKVHTHVVARPKHLVDATADASVKGRKEVVVWLGETENWLGVE